MKFFIIGFVIPTSRSSIASSMLARKSTPAERGVAYAGISCFDLLIILIFITIRFIDFHNRANVIILFRSKAMRSVLF